MVLLANLAGTWLFAWVLSHEGIFANEIWQALNTIAQQAASATLFALVMKSIILTTIVALGTMPHIIAGSVEAAWSALTGETSIGRYVAHFLLPTLLGNTAGGVALTALLNHAPIAKELHDSERA